MIRRGTVLSIGSTEAQVTLDYGSTVPAAWVGGEPGVGSTVLVEPLGSATWCITGELGALPWSMPWGTIGYVEMSADVTPGAGPIDLPGLQIDFTGVASRRYRARGSCLFQASGGTLNPLLQLLMNGTTQAFGAAGGTLASGDVATVIGERVFSASVTGAQSWKLRAIRQAGTGNIATARDTTRPDFFHIEDIGPL